MQQQQQQTIAFLQSRTLCPAAPVAWHPFRHGLARDKISYVSVNAIVQGGKHQVRHHDGTVLPVAAHIAQALIAGHGPQAAGLNSTLHRHRRANRRAAIQPHKRGFKYVFGMIAIVLGCFAFLTTKKTVPIKAASEVSPSSPPRWDRASSGSTYSTGAHCRPRAAGRRLEQHFAQAPPC